MGMIEEHDVIETLERERVDPRANARPSSSVSAGAFMGAETVISIRDLAVHYNNFLAVTDVSFDVPKHRVTALIGPSGCGKSTVLRCINRMNDLVASARVSGTVLYHGVDINARSVDAVEVRRRIGMVFQRPNPFPKSI